MATTSLQYDDHFNPQPDVDLEAVRAAARRRAVPMSWAYRFPWWGVALVLFAIYFIYIVSNEFSYTAGIGFSSFDTYGLMLTSNPVNRYGVMFSTLVEGVITTLRVSAWAYICALLIGLFIALTRINKPKPPNHGAPLSRRLLNLVHIFLYNITTLYVEVFRGLPILVVLLIIAFVLVPAVRDAINAALGYEFLQIRGTSEQAAIIALAMTYSAYMSETMRAGIQSIEKGQYEAARSLGMNYVATMRNVVLPQAIRRVLPPLGNDLVAMIKDSSLVSVLGVSDITQIARVTAGSNFWYLETYLTVAVIYLTLTIIGTRLIRWMERYFTTHP